MLTLEEQEKAARVHREAHREGARRFDGTEGRVDLGKGGPPKSINVVELSEQVLKQAYELRSAMETFYGELLGSAVATAINDREEPPTERNAGVIPQTKGALNEISYVLDKLRHLISSASMGIR